MKRVRPALAAAALLLGLSAEARVVSYAPITSRQSIPAVQKRTNRHALLIEQVSVMSPPGPSCISCFTPQARLVVYDTQGVEEPRDVTPGGAPAVLYSAAAFEAEDGVLTLFATGWASLAPGDNPTGLRAFFSRDGGTTWSTLALPALPGVTRSVDTGGPVVNEIGSGIRIGTRENPFLLAFNEFDSGWYLGLWDISAAGVARRRVLASYESRLVGMDREGRRALLSGTPLQPSGQGGSGTGPGLYIVDPDGSVHWLSNEPGNDWRQGWITPDGQAYVVGFVFPPWHRSVTRVGAGTRTEIATDSPSEDSTLLFAVPTADFSGAWMIQRGTGPTVLSSHTPAGGLVEAWRDVTRPEVEALHAGSSGTRLLVQVHRPRPQVDQRIFKDPALAIWEVGSPAPTAYDELFLQETDYKGFVHLDVDAAATGAPFLFDSGASYSAFFPPVAGPSGGGGGGDVVQEWGVVRGSLRQRLVIPAAAHASGMFGAAWRTNLVLRNPDAEAVRVTVGFLPNADAAASAPDATVVLPASSVLTVPDVLSTLFGLPAGAGALLLSPEGARSIEATSRTYTPAAGGGTYGMSVAAVDVFAALGTNFPVSFSAALLGDGFRSNLVTTDVSGRGSSAGLLVSGDSGAPGPLEGAIATPAASQRQVSDLAAALGAPAWRAGSLLFTPRGGETIAGLIVIDNATNDPTWFPPDVPSLVARTIPAVVHADGAKGAKFRTDLFLYNPSERMQSVTLAIKLWSENTTERLLTLPLLPRESKTIRDVLFAAFGLSGVARLRFQTFGALDDSGGIRVTSRTYTVTPSGGTYGLLLPALNGFQSAGGGESLEILLPAGGAGFRTNLALVDLSSAPGSGSVAVKVEIFDEAGIRRDVFETPVPLAGGVQIDDLFHGRGLGDGPLSGVLRISPAGGLVAAYASVIDNVTNDPLYAPPVLAAKP
ncbi:MAG: hypothetical protein IPL89_02185 [Acidobacteria bacterium]|nr:hypothetical protein [Acidobacteriota bacterium]